MNIHIIVFILSIIVTALFVFVVVSKIYQKKIDDLQNENSQLKVQIGTNDKVLDVVKLEFSKIAQESLKSQQELLLTEQVKDYQNKMDLFKAEELTPINKMLQEFKLTIDNYQKEHYTSTQEIKNAISVAEKYARALTTNQNLKGSFGEDMLEQIFKFASLQENIHYKKQVSTTNGKPDYVLFLPNNNHIIIDSKVILKNFIEFQNGDNQQDFKKACINDLTTCIKQLSDRNYEQIKEFNQPNFILMYIPIESFVNYIYTDIDFKKVVDLATSKNIIIVGNASLLVTLRLINQIWASKVQTDNIQNIIETGQNIYNYISTHLQALFDIQKSINNASDSIQSEINRFTKGYKGSIIKEAEKLRDYGIEITKGNK